MLVTAIRALGNGRGTDTGIERRPVPGKARRMAANVAKLLARDQSGQSRQNSKACFAADGNGMSKSLT
jgi:hypothetical protein